MVRPSSSARWQAASIGSTAMIRAVNDNVHMIEFARSAAQRRTGRSPPQVIFMGIAPKKSRLPTSTPQWRRIE
jgi:hypothetical protein